MLDTEQCDIGLETQQDSDSSDEDIAETQDTQTGGTQKCKGKTREGQHVSEEKADKRSKKPAILFSAKEQKLVSFFVTMKFSTTNIQWTTRIGQRRRLCGISFVRRTTGTKLPAKDGFRSSAHSSERSLT